MKYNTRFLFQTKKKYNSTGTFDNSSPSERDSTLLRAFLLNLVLERHFPLSIILFSVNLAFNRVGKMSLEKVRLIKNSKQVKFRGFLRLAVTFKINSQASYRAQIHRKHLSSPFCSQNRALTDAN